ncbi:dehydrodolichyl diphosphate synthase complex subunit Nus1 [Tribolium castaneum]|uniref:ditrans,polycis-polyprenyl diphosphate synthase [(2E,6E)-farnesyldiphosphate specific] n=1 Tax=Tribolium castaneum TaxID=7070 RepID=D6X458_TRICA|nr:PREDICTED: dehydrodolichyl diphosphate syntase complex subunit Nus1 [Tribolium castaneum]EEZ97509.1 Nogo-B receptor-like Protein [Tribolium castaneum]|eukprot:XP_972659.1 PREDICTED: dehydrodolichyl diphosphate syntase complex subunit Nus1 [Tribolium castaneum]
MDQKSPSVIHRACYLTLNVIYTIYEIIASIFRQKLLIFLCHEIDSRPKKITKVPTHLTVLLGNEEPAVKDLANLILWCLSARITFISFYDYKGSLRQCEDKLRQLVEEKKNEEDHVIWHSRPDFVHKNGYKGRKIHVKLLGEEDGRGTIANVTKTLASAANSDLLQFETELLKQFEFPDPDLGVCCGKTFSLYGYPPWQIRVTEFLTLQTHHNITLETFIHLLYRFNKCEQRYGK